MRTFNPNKKLQIEIHCNDMSNTNGYTVWHVVNGERKRTMSRRADGKDFDWMNDKELEDFTERGKYKFSITASQASQYFQYIY
jgi:N-acetylmuramoyl-L-alanine amidase